MSYPIALRRANWMLVCLTGVLLAVWFAPQSAFVQGTSVMPLWLHIVAEAFAVVVAAQTFGIAWHAYAAERPGNILILACALLSVGILDIGHTLSFPGMPDFITPADTEKSINFWLVARLIAASALFAVAIRKWKPLTHAYLRHLLLAAFLAIASGAYWLALFHADVWPRTYTQGNGLTPFKIRAEYLISAMLALSALLFYRKARRQHDDAMTINLFAASAIMALSEITLTLYGHVTDVFNLLGHLYKITAYLFIYKAVFVSSVREPFEKLRTAQQHIKTSQQMLSSIVDTVPVRIFWKDRYSRFLGANQLFLKDAGLRSVYELAGRSDAHLFPEHAAAYVQDDRNVMESGIPRLDIEDSVHTADGSVRHLLMSKVPLHDADGKSVIGVLGTYTDITDLKIAEETVRYQANFDDLTRLPNRRLFNDRLIQEIKKSTRGGRSVALLFIDLDRFKEINDTLGHGKGDQLLIEAAARLRQCVRESDTVARLGGDEFAVILGELDDMGCVERIAQDILGLLAEPFHLDHESAYVSASIGITVYPGDTTDLELLLQHADQAMYAAKNQGRSRFNYFTPSMQHASQARMRLTNDLRTAIADEQLKLYYQPIVHLASGDIHKAEALIRWEHPIQGLISPTDFIPIAEDSGFIADIGNWVFFEAARQAKRWREGYCRDFQISINKSPLQFQAEEDAHRAWFEYLDKLALPGVGITVEITEGILMDASEDVIHKLVQLRRAGIKVSLDDFGTGYSGLSYLKKFNIDFLKIDQSFTRSLSPDSVDLALCEAMIIMAHRLGIKVIAEGIETEQQRRLLTEAGCDYGQGYLFSRPIPSDEFEQLIWPVTIDN